MNKKHQSLRVFTIIIIIATYFQIPLANSLSSEKILELIFELNISIQNQPQSTTAYHMNEKKLLFQKRGFFVVKKTKGGRVYRYVV